jgi:hypothetical protein
MNDVSMMSPQDKDDSVKPKGPPKGSANGFKYGAYSLLAMRVRGRPNGNTRLGRAFRALEKEYWQDLGGVESMSLSQRRLVEDNVWCDFMVAVIDYDLQGRKQLTRKGKPLPLIDLRIRVAAHRRDNYKLLGLKRVAKTVSWEDYLEDIKQETRQQENGKGGDEP